MRFAPGCTLNRYFQYCRFFAATFHGCSGRASLRSAIAGKHRYQGKAQNVGWYCPTNETYTYLLVSTIICELSLDIRVRNVSCGVRTPWTLLPYTFVVFTRSTGSSQLEVARVFSYQVFWLVSPWDGLGQVVDVLVVIQRQAPMFQEVP